MRIKYFLLSFIFGFFLDISASFCGDSRLLFFTETSCPYCQWWEKDIGDIYPKTEYSKEFQLTRITFDKDFNSQASSLKKSILGTPTFVFVYLGKEIGRIEGYNGPEMFWWQVESIVNGKKTE
jgi:thioredoxin-related protein